MGRECVIVACHDRLDDLAVQLEVQPLVAPGAEVVVVHTGQGPVPDGPRDGEVRLVSEGFRTGPVLALLAGLRWAQARGCRRVVYRNADDWLLNPATHAGVSQLMDAGKVAAGYSWLDPADLTLNELWLDVPTFAPLAFDFEERIRLSGPADLCERLAGAWVSEVVGGGMGFQRLTERESYPPVGWLDKDLRMAAIYNPDAFPPGFWSVRADNNRFFCRRWLLIGSHDNGERLAYWRKVRDEVPIRAEMERGQAFRRWLHAAEGGLPWNGRQPVRRACPGIRPRLLAPTTPARAPAAA
jgi:hypothetical protein